MIHCQLRSADLVHFRGKHNVIHEWVKQTCLYANYYKEVFQEKHAIFKLVIYGDSHYNMATHIKLQINHLINSIQNIQQNML